MFDSIKEGIVAAGRAWPVTLLQFGASILYVLAFFIMVLLPAVVLFVSLGVDVSGLEYVPEDPAELLTLLGGHVGGILFVFLALLLWMCVVLAAAMFVYGGTLGALKEALGVPGASGDVGVFFRSGRRHFWPMVWLVTVVSLIGLLPFFVGGAGIFAAAATGLFSGGGTGGVFIGYFTVVGCVMAALVLCIGTMAYWSFASAALVAGNLRGGEAVGEGWRFLRENPSSIAYYLLVVMLYVCTMLGLMVLIVAVQFVPFVGILLALPLQIINSVVTVFLGIAMNGAFLAYYLKATGRWIPATEVLPLPELAPDAPFSPGENI